MASFRDRLADYVEGQAEWRSEKADQYPDDARNRRCADGLKGLERYLRSLDEDDERLSRIETEHRRLFHRPEDADDQSFMPGEAAARSISRFRFNIPNESFDALLRRLPSDLADDAADFAREMEGAEEEEIAMQDTADTVWSTSFQEAEFRAAAMLLARVSDATENLDEDAKLIRWRPILERRRGYSTGEQILVDLARMLWSGQAQEWGIRDAIRVFDDRNWRTFVEALQVLRPVR